MELELLVDRYKTTPIAKRLTIVFVAALVIPAWIFVEDGAILDEELQQTENAVEASRSKYESARKKTVRLPELEEQYSVIQNQIAKAKKYLPKEIAIDTILNTVGIFEKELDVKVTQFTPGSENKPDPNYTELPITISVVADFPKVMAFYDRIIHLTKIIHLRGMKFENVNEDQNKAGTVISKAELVVFRSN